MNRSCLVLMILWISQPVWAGAAATYAKQGMVVSQNRIASAVGVAVLRDGGSAVAAAIATAFALRVRTRCPEDDIAQRVSTMFELALNRNPTARESERCAAFVEQALAAGQNEDAVWFHLAGAVLNLDEMISIE